MCNLQQFASFVYNFLDDKEMDVDNSDGETKIKSENPASSSSTLNRPDEYKEKTSNASSTAATTDASASNKLSTSDSVPVVSTSDRINQQKPSESIHSAPSSSSSTTSTPFSLMTSTNNPSSVDVNKVSVSSSGVITSETVSNAQVVNAIGGDSSLNDVNIKQEIIDRDSPSPNLPSYAVSKHSVSEFFACSFEFVLCSCFINFSPNLSFRNYILHLHMEVCYAAF